MRRILLCKHAIQTETLFFKSKGEHVGIICFHVVYVVLAYQHQAHVMLAVTNVDIRMIYTLEYIFIATT